MKALSLSLPEVAIVASLAHVFARPSWVSAVAFVVAVLLSLGCRLIAYRQAEDVSALSARLAKVEELSARAERLAAAASQRKPQGF